MKKRVLTQYITVLLFLTVGISKAVANTPNYYCGGWYYDGDYFYYNLFNQENISQKAFYPFLRTNENPFYKDQALKDTKNVYEWYTFFNQKYSKEVLTEVLYGKENMSYKIKGVSAKEKAAKIYLNFAKSCEQVSVNKEKYYWDYKALIKKRKHNAPELINEGMLLHSKENHKALKLRYAYQLIRLFRYNYEFKKAIDFFNNEVASLEQKNEIYYYILDQIAGCYYKQKNYEKAAYLFLKVFDKSIDKKKSAYLSYKFCTNKNAEGKTLLRTSEEKASQIFITAIRKFSDTMQDLEKITALGVSEDKQELLVIRMINNIERAILKINYKKPIFQSEEGIANELSILENYIQQKVNSNSTNIEFWQLTDAYVSFLKKDINTAKEKLKTIKTKQLEEQKENLSIVFKVFSWQEITPIQEKWLSDFFNGDIKKNTRYGGGCYSDNNDERISCNIKRVIIDQVSHLYLNQDEVAKSYLLHNSLENLKDISSQQLADDMISFIKKKDKNNFEKFMLSDVLQKGFSEEKILAIARKAKGLMYFRSGDFNTAVSYFSPSEQTEIPPTVFSNNTMECFDCDVSLVMEDEVYKASAYIFLNTKMNTYELLTNLQELERMTKDESLKQWKRKLAYYLLGNYFFNVSNTGYYRTIVYPGRDTYYNYDFVRKRPEIEDVVVGKKTYSFPNYGYGNTYNALAKKAKYYYEQTIANSTDNELNARCAYMIAKCELNAYYNNGWESNYSGYEGDHFRKFENSGFKALKTKYRNTKFYQKIRSKCSFFRQYDAN